MSTEIAKLIKEALDEHLGKDRIKMQDVYRMQYVPTITNGTGHNILSIQYGDLTVMVWLLFDKNEKPYVRNVKVMPW